MATKKALPQELGSNAVKRRASASPLGRVKAASILIREEKKSDKRQALTDALIAKFSAKYAKNDPEFAESIVAMTQRLLLNSRRRIIESDIIALETVIRKMSGERQAKRAAAQAKAQQNALDEGVPCVKYAFGENSARSGGTVAGTARTNNQGLCEELRNQEEWVLLNALTLVEFEKDQEKEKRKLAEKKKMQRGWLDQQQAEKVSVKENEKRESLAHYEHQMSDVHKWHEQESLKKQQQREQLLKIRQERDQQLAAQKRRHEQAEAKRQHDEALEVERVRNELKRQEEEAQRRRILEHERMRRLVLENSSVQKEKGMKKMEEQQEDVKLMEAYARRLAKEEEDRVAALKKKLKRQDQIQHGIAESIQLQLRQKALEDERRAEEYQRKKDEMEREKQLAEQKRRRQEAIERRQFLDMQHEQKEARRKKEIEEEMAFAQQFHQEGRLAVEAQKRQVQQTRVRNRDFQAQVIEQMEEQRKNQPFSPLHLPRALMNSREKNINAKLLQKLEEPEITEQVLRKLSPTKEHHATHSTIPTTFY